MLTLTTDTRKKNDLIEEYVFEQMMPPGAPFGNYDLVTFPFGRNRGMEKPLSRAADDTPLWYLKIAMLPSYTTADMDGFISLMKEADSAVQTAEEEYPADENTAERINAVFRRNGRVTESGVDGNGNYHVVGYVYLDPGKRRSTRFFDRDVYRCVCRIPVLCDFTLYYDRVTVKCSGIPTGAPGLMGHAGIAGFPYAVMGEENPALRAMDIIDGEMTGTRTCGDDSFAKLRRKEFRAYCLEYTALKCVFPLLIVPVLYIVLYLAFAHGNSSKLLFFWFTVSLAAVPVISACGALLHLCHLKLIDDLWMPPGRGFASAGANMRDAGFSQYRR